MKYHTDKDGWSGIVRGLDHHTVEVVKVKKHDNLFIMVDSKDERKLVLTQLDRQKAIELRAALDHFINGTDPSGEGV